MWPRRSNGDGVVSMDDADGDGDADDDWDCDWDADEFSEFKLRGVWWWTTFLFSIFDPAAADDDDDDDWCRNVRLSPIR